MGDVFRASRRRERAERGEQHDGGRGGRAGHEQPGRAEQGGDDGRDHRRVEPVLGRHPGDGSEGDALRENHEHPGHGGQCVGAHGVAIDVGPPLQERRELALDRAKQVSSRRTRPGSVLIELNQYIILSSFAVFPRVSAPGCSSDPKGSRGSPPRSSAPARRLAVATCSSRSRARTSRSTHPNDPRSSVCLPPRTASIPNRPESCSPGPSGRWRNRLALRVHEPPERGAFPGREGGHGRDAVAGGVRGRSSRQVRRAPDTKGGRPPARAAPALHPAKLKAERDLPRPPHPPADDEQEGREDQHGPVAPTSRRGFAPSEAAGRPPARPFRTAGPRPPPLPAASPGRRSRCSSRGPATAPARAHAFAPSGSAGGGLPCHRTRRRC